MPAEFMVKTVKGLRSTAPSKASLWSQAAHKIALNRAQQTFDRVEPFLKGKVLDIGVGSGSLYYLLREAGYEVEGVDVKNISIYEDINPVIYNGTDLPFGNRRFDTALIALVLHHCSEPLKVLKEAKRVAKRVVIVEDTFVNEVEHKWVEVYDAVLNAEFYKHEYHSVKEWKQIFKDNKWNLVELREWQQISFGVLYGRYCLMVIE